MDTLRDLIERSQRLTAAREAILTVEGETGYFDADAMHGIEDDCCDIVAALAEIDLDTL